MYASATNQNNTTAKDSLTKCQWINWCRLCAKEDNKNNINFLYKKEGDDHSEYGSKKLSIQEALAKYFWLQTSLEDSLPKMICTDCLSLVSSLITFDERVERVQIMYHYLSHFHSIATNNSDLNSVRLKYDVIEQERDQWFSNYGCTKELNVDKKCHVLETSESLQLSEGDKHLQIQIELENGLIQSLDNKDHVEEDDTDNTWGEVLCYNNLNDSYEEGAESSFDPNEENLEKTVNNSEQKSYAKALQTGEKDSFILKPGGSKRKKKRKELKQCFSSQNKKKKSYIEDFEIEITCKECDTNFTKYVTYRDHLQQTHNQQMNNKHWPCPLCDKHLSSSSSLKRHVLLHGPLEISKPFKCPDCDNRFTSNADLEKHKRIKHKKERPFICEECGLCFSGISNLRQHILIHHTDIARYECEVCKKRFKIKSRLKFHMDIHSPNKHVCNICGLELNSRATLKRHKVVHSDKKQHKCDYCGKGFKRSNALKNHLLRHTGLKPYSCDFCVRTFNNRSGCRFHMKKRHPNELATLDASGNKTHTKNIPRLEALKALTKAADNLTPVRPN